MPLSYSAPRGGMGGSRQDSCRPAGRSRLQGRDFFGGSSTRQAGDVVSAGSRQRSSAGKRDEIPPPHSITSSARPSIIGATVMPSALAVLRLITNSNFVGKAIGNSPGLLPFK